jgi:predicted transcriptional regulator
MPRQKQEKQVTKAVRLLHAGKTQQEVANLCGVSLRTVQRWASQNAAELQNLQSQEKAIIQSDPIVLTLTDIRSQVQEILDYRDSQRNFALEMGVVVQRTIAILSKTLERLEQNPDEITVRNLPQLMRAVADCAEKVSGAWSRATGLDDLLENLNDEPQVTAQGQTEA